MNPAASLTSSTVSAPVRDASERLRARSRATGVLVMTVFGALWAATGVVTAGAAAWAWIAIAAIAAGLAMQALQLLRANPAVHEALAPALAAQRRRAGRIFLWTSVGEGLGIFLAVNVVVNLGHPQWQAAAVMAVVGLHFLPLARAFGYRPHVVTGLAMTAWAVGYPACFAAGALAPAGLFGAAAILFASAAWALRSVGARRA